MSRTKIAVKIENKTFTSLKEACEYLKLKHSAGLAHALKKGNTTYNGLHIERLSPVSKGNKRNHKKQSCPVLCENLNVRFKTITEAAKYAQADGWTMSKKMETAGQFIDKNGNVYKRMKPMKSKNVYENTGAEVKRVVEFHARPAARKEVIQPAQPVIDKVQLAKDVLKEKVISSINANDYTLAKNLIDVIQEL